MPKLLLTCFFTGSPLGSFSVAEKDQPSRSARSTLLRPIAGFSVRSLRMTQAVSTMSPKEWRLGLPTFFRRGP